MAPIVVTPARYTYLAVQWTGDNLDEIEQETRITGFVKNEDGTLTYPPRFDGTEPTINVGDWVMFGGTLNGPREYVQSNLGATSADDLRFSYDVLSW